MIGNQEYRASMIILLYGTSTSGKTTICESLQKLIENLKIDSTDSAFKRLNVNDFSGILNYIAEHKDQFIYLSQVQSRFTDIDICNGILDEKINISNNEVPLLFDLEEQAFIKVLEELFGEGDLIEKQSINQLRNIAKSYLNQLFVAVHENIFDLAITHSMQGVSTILDIVPHPEQPGQFMIDLFLSQLKKRKHSGSTHIALVHCSIPQLSERMLARNREALMNSNPENIRDKAFPFRQYSQLFGGSNLKTGSLGDLKIEDAKKAITPFCIDSLEIKKIIEKLGFDNQLNEIYIHAKCDYDQIYDSEALTSSEIADKMVKILE